MEKINVYKRLSGISEYWKPEVLGELNNDYIKVAKIKGDFIWHTHDDEDEMFLVLDGDLTIRLRDGDIKLSRFELIIIPKGVEHMPVANGEVSIMLIEPKTTVNTGNIVNELTVNFQE